VQHDLVPLFDQKFGGHFSEAVGGAGDEDARHSRVLQALESAANPSISGALNIPISMDGVGHFGAR
jgi:hypothetical protein